MRTLVYLWAQTMPGHWLRVAGANGEQIQFAADFTDADDYLGAIRRLNCEFTKRGLRWDVGRPTEIAAVTRDRRIELGARAMARLAWERGHIYPASGTQDEWVNAHWVAYRDTVQVILDAAEAL